MNVSNAGSQEREARPGERDTRDLEVTGTPLELPTWQQIVSAIRDEDKALTVRLLLGVIEELSQRLTDQSQRIYAELKAYRVSPSPSQDEILRASFDAIVTGSATISIPTGEYRA